MKLQSNENVGRPTDKEDLYPLIKYLIEDEGLSTQEACDEAGIHRSTFYRWCRAKGNTVSRANKARKRTAPSAKKILEYWRSDSASWYLDNMSKSAGIKFDFHLKVNPIHQQCFACNRVFINHKWGERNILERSHIVPHALGGSDSPVNFVLLCKHCHLENPNVDNEITYLRWLQSHKSRVEIVSDEIHYLAKGMIDRNKLNKALSVARLDEIIPKGVDIENYSVEHQGVNFSTIISVLCSKIDDILDEHHEIRIRKGC
jgi:5-methylcytosine-specific restriction endonuclease McrA